MARRLLLAALAAACACAGFATLGSASVNVAQSGWSWGNPAPQGNTLAQIDFVQGRGFAAGEAGTVLRTDDGGTTWTGLSTGTSANLIRLQVLDPETLTVLSGDGCVLRRSDDAGTTFHKIFIVAEQNCPAPVRAFTFFDRQVGYLLLGDGSVLRTADAGQTFSRQTAIPGTAGSTTGGSREAADLAFTTADTGIAFLKPGAGPLAYSTTDGGVSWKPIDGLTGNVRRAWFLDAQNGFAVGPDTLLATADGGKTWTPRPAGTGQDLTGIRCIDTKTCLLTTANGDKLLRTADGGQTATQITPSSQAIYAAAFNSPTRVTAVGLGGATVVSDDGGVNYLQISSDIGGEYQGLQAGPTPSTAFALGKRGSLAATTDSGATWRTLAVPTSHDIVSVSFATPDTGYALDNAGGLFKTTNAGKTWQTLDTGTASAPSSIAAPAPDVVVIVAPGGIYRGQGAAQPQRVGGKAVARAGLDTVGGRPKLLFAYGSNRRQIFTSTTRGKTWTAVKLPKKVRVGYGAGAADFVTAKIGFVIDTRNRVWKTRNGGKAWTQLLGVAAQPQGLSMADAANGLLALAGGFPAQTETTGYTLRTSDGGKTWRPQSIARGVLRQAIASSAQQGYALLENHHLFFTGTGGDAGSPTTIRIRTAVKSFTRKSLKKAKRRVTVTGSIPGAVGGEQVVVSRRDLTSTGYRWSHQVVTAGANGGSFTTSWTIKRSSVFVAQWAGDSGRRGAGSVPLVVSVKR
ncbi:MAG TPA: YCF48-related protein [Thermoleophilaceae bacterium]|nr:YCF48-related protein [Thermoleophilaceae bacterium]